MENKQINNPTRSELITDFVKSNPEYYIKEFQKIGSKPSFSFSFNLSYDSPNQYAPLAKLIGYPTLL